jgi:hypothetical protein
MKYLKISNSTEIEANAFMLVGACTKRDDNTKIGYFGSGLKYAMAVLLREGTKINIYSGVNKIELNTTVETLRGQNFDVITIDGKKTNLTTDMGIKWKLWQAVREIYCNALDEDGFNSEIVEQIKPVENETAFYLTITGNEQLEAIMANWDRYFANNRIIHAACSHGKVMFPKESTVSVYRKGVRCYEQKRPSLFDYDLDNIEITESRLIEYEFLLFADLGKIWRECATGTMIKKLLALTKDGNIENYIEYDIDWSYGNSFNPAWLEILKDVIVIPYEYAGHYRDVLSKQDAVILPHKLLRKLIDYFGAEINCPATSFDRYGKYCVTEPSNRDAFLLKESLKFFEEVGLSIDHPIEIAIFQDKRILGTVSKDKKIVLSTKVMELGKKKIVSTIMEECFHLESAMSDETREFQNYLINQMVTLLENTNGVFL